MINFDLLEGELESAGGFYIFIELFFLYDIVFTSIQLMMEDLPTSAMPTTAILMFYSARLDRDRSRSVSME